MYKIVHVSWVNSGDMLCNAVVISESEDHAIQIVGLDAREVTDIETMTLGDSIVHRHQIVAYEAP